MQDGHVCRLRGGKREREKKDGLGDRLPSLVSALSTPVSVKEKDGRMNGDPS